LYYKNEEKMTKAEWLSKEIPKIKEETYKCMMVNNFFWSVWAFHMLKE